MELILEQKESFQERIIHNGVNPNRTEIKLLQLNITKKCNQSCHHCHVNAGPARTEEMSLDTIKRILFLISRSKTISTVDITGGAPELNPGFRYLIRGLQELEVNIIDRCNLTVLLEKGQEETAEFLAQNKVTVIASLPCYLEENVDSQRGDDIYKRSIQALKHLNQLGYGREGSGLHLHLVYNPLGAYLPGDQKELEKDYKHALQKAHGITFNNLYTITNMPINRFAAALKAEGKYGEYCELLRDSFNAEAADKIMCKNQVSIRFDGKIFDCDFNQALHMPLSSGRDSIWEIEDFTEISNKISYGSHCYGCTAGCGSSCQGSLMK